MRTLFTCLLSLLLSHTLWAQNDVGIKDPNAEYRHHVAFTPIAGLIAYDYGNPGMGFDYEYMFDLEHRIGVHFPFAFGFPTSSSYENHSQTYVAPGILFHTGSRLSRVDFATGPSFMIGNLHFGSSNNNPYPVSPTNHTLVGFLVDNSINFNKEHFQFGFDVRMGPLLNEFDNQRFFIHFGMHFGGRF
jgi:hypothetical protein